MNTTEFLYIATAICPDRPFIVFEGNQWSFVQFNERVNRLANAFRELGIQKGDRILRFDGAEVKNSFDLVYAVKNVPPGDSVSIEIKRGYETLRVDAHFTNPAAD